MRRPHQLPPFLPALERNFVMPISRTRVLARSPGDLLAAVPPILGFHPSDSLVVLALSGPHARVSVACRFDLPDPPSRSSSGDLAEHIVQVLHQNNAMAAAIMGCGPARLVTPVIDVAGNLLPRSGIRLYDSIRVTDGRYWSYLCGDIACCPPEGRLLPDITHPVAATLARAGYTAAENRDAVATVLAPVSGPEAQAMAEATRQAEIAAAGQLASLSEEAVVALERQLVQDIIQAYRDGQPVTDPAVLARVWVSLAYLEIRDDAWARKLSGIASDGRGLSGLAAVSGLWVA
jgi:uncharacterized protein DUF4192